jgi:peptidoglycan/xylan/chitin deacetylase (PgdA/CDA1 family)
MQRNQMMAKIPVIISLDVHSHVYQDKLDEIPIWIEKTLRILDDIAIKASFFFPAECAEQLSKEVRTILDEGHEIGCHSLTHKPDEQYNHMPFEDQKSKLSEAKKRIEEVTMKKIVSFRAPVFKLNGNTIRALDEVGFKLDSSVCPQRVGIFSSDITNVGWLFSPRKPYHPSYNNPFTRGEALLWEVPVSSFIVPFMANVGMAFGRVVEKLFFKFLYTESVLFKNPIVYLFHPEDIEENRETAQYKFQWKHLLPTKSHGFKVRYALYNRNHDPKKTAENVVSLFRTIKSQNNINFLTCENMLSLLESKSAL